MLTGYERYTINELKCLRRCAIRHGASRTIVAGLTRAIMAAVAR